jgi:phage terminase large subunit GpA-like protein
MTPQVLDPLDSVVQHHIRPAFRIPDRPPLSTWAESNFILSPEYSAYSGPLHLFSWQREILDAMTDPTVEEVVLMTGVQMTKSISLMTYLAYVVDQDPGPVLLVVPDEDSGRHFSKRRLAPMIRDCPCLHGKMSESLHDAQNTLLAKSFPGGNLLIVTARSPIGLAQHTIRYLFCDEPDKYPASVISASGEHEGDPMDLAWERANTFGSRRKRVMACSPTAEGKSRIATAYDASDRRRFQVPCPICGQFQVLRFSQVKGLDGGSFVPDPSHARIECVNVACKAHWTELQRWDAIQSGKWVAERPFAGIAGFWINQLYSPSTWKSTGKIARQFLKAKKSPTSLRTFVNTVLAETWQEGGQRPDHEVLQRTRTEPYPFNLQAVIPKRGMFLTAGVDVQESPPRLEVEVKAWGRDRENWSIYYGVLQAFADNGQALPATSPELWDMLGELLDRDWPHASGHTLPIWVMAIDTGKLPKPVYDFALRYPRCSFNPATGLRPIVFRTVIPTKGDDNPQRILSAVSTEDAARKRQNIRILTIGTHCAKGEIYAYIRDVEPHRDPSGGILDEPVAGLYHWPAYALEYFQQLTSEVRLETAEGKVIWEKRGRNEAFDCAIMNRAAAALCGIDRPNFPWDRMESALNPASVLPPSPVPDPAPTPSPTPTVLESKTSASNSGAGAGLSTGISSSVPPPAPPPIVQLPTPPPPPQPMSAAQLARMEWEWASGQGRPQTDIPFNRPARPVRGRFS